MSKVDRAEMIENLISALDKDLKKYSSPDKKEKLIQLRRKIFDLTKKSYYAESDNPYGLPVLSTKPVVVHKRS